MSPKKSNRLNILHTVLFIKVNMNMSPTDAKQSQTALTIVCMLTSAPLSKSIFTHSMRPLHEALMSAVSPPWKDKWISMPHTTHLSQICTPEGRYTNTVTNTCQHVQYVLHEKEVNMQVLYLKHKQHMPYNCAKYRTIAFSLLIRPLLPCLLHHCCLEILYATNFLIENVFSYLCH